MMPYMSIIIPTLRVGGLDILLAGLERQSFKDFELILVDSLYKYRKEIVRERTSEYSFPIKHIEPIDNPFPLNSYQRCVNSGLVHAEGKIAYFTCDYAWPHPNTIEGHANFHKSMGEAHAMLGVCHISELPKIDEKFPLEYGLTKLGSGRGVPKSEVEHQWETESIRHRVTQEWCESYCRDLESGRLDKFMWSIFEEEFKVRDDPRGLEILHIETKSGRPEGFLEPQFCHLKNDSIPIKHLLEVNGFDEAYDGSHGWQDTEIATRLSARTGLKWYFSPTSIVHITSPHRLILIRKMNRLESSNENMYLANNPRGYPDPVNNWSLTDMRSRLGIH